MAPFRRVRVVVVVLATVVCAGAVALGGNHSDISSGARCSRARLRTWPASYGTTKDAKGGAMPRTIDLYRVVVRKGEVTLYCPDAVSIQAVKVRGIWLPS